MHLRARTIGVVVAALAVGTISHRGARADEADDLLRLRAEVAALRREVRSLRERVAALEAKVAANGSATLASGLDPSLGFAVPGVPDGGATSPSELATLLQDKLGHPEELEGLLAFGKVELLVPEALWARATKGLGAGTPTRAELEVALEVLRARASTGAKVDAITAIPVPGVDETCVRLLDVSVRSERGTDHHRLTAARIGGKWRVAHLLLVFAEEDARSFVDELAASQRAFFVFRGRKGYASSLRELAQEQKQLESSANLKAAGLGFPLGARLDRLARDRVEWSQDDLLGPLYRLRVASDGANGYVVRAVPRLPGYRGYGADVPVGADLKAKVAVRELRPGEASPEAPR